MLLSSFVPPGIITIYTIYLIIYLFIYFYLLYLSLSTVFCHFVVSVWM
jgi:hypothetical protein